MGPIGALALAGALALTAACGLAPAADAGNPGGPGKAGPPVAGTQDPFEARKERMLAAAAAQETQRDFFVITAKLRAGIDVPRALSTLDSLTRDENVAGMFYAFHLIGAYLHASRQLPDSLHRKIRRAYRERTMIRGDTENHWVMYYTGLYLAAQTWPGLDGSQWFNGKGSAANAAEAAAFLDHWIRLTATRGQGEFDSPTYFQTFAAPMLLLHDFAADPALRRKARMMLDLLFADFAAEHLRGNYVGAHSRDYPQDILNPLGALSTKWAWLYFGEPDFEPWASARAQSRHPSWETVFGALSGYRIPDVVLGMATDRSVPYVHRETKRTRNILRYGDGGAKSSPPVRKYTYMTADYALGSIEGGIAQPSQQHTWDLTFVSDKPNNTLFTLHPFYSGKELAMFFPEEQKVLTDEVNRFHLTYIDPRKWNSSSPYEQVFQHEDALIALYDLAPGAMHPHIDGFFPKTLDERAEDPSGWIFCRAGKTYVAFFPLKPYEWIEEEAGWRWRSRELRNGIVLEAGSEGECGTFEDFKRSIRAAGVGRRDFDSSLTVAHRTRRGAEMRFTYGGPRLLDGKPADPARHKAFDGPFLRSEAGSGIVAMSHGGRTRKLDFNRATIDSSMIDSSRDRRHGAPGAAPRR